MGRRVFRAARKLEITTATKADIKPLGQILANVFENSPLVAHIFPDPEKRVRVNRWLNERIVSYGLAYGTVYTDEQRTGAAVYLPVTGRAITLPRLFRLGLHQAPFRMGIGGLRRFLSFSSLTEKVHKRHVTGDHYFELAAGVDHSRHDSALSSAMTMTALVKAGTDVADREGRTCYTETVFENAKDWYLSFGYEVVEEVDLPDVGPMWALARKPVGERAGG